MKRLQGFTLIELLIGLALFSMMLVLAAGALRVSSSVMSLARTEMPLEVTLQRAADDVNRLVRQAQDAAIQSPTALVLTQGDGTVKTVAFINGALSLDGVPLQGGLTSVNFAVSQGGLYKVVTVTATAGAQAFPGSPRIKSLISCASLRSALPVQAPPPPAPALATPQVVVQAPPPPAAPAPPPPPPPPAPPVVPVIPRYHYQHFIDCVFRECPDVP